MIVSLKERAAYLVDSHYKLRDAKAEHKHGLGIEKTNAEVTSTRTR